MQGPAAVVEWLRGELPNGSRVPSWRSEPTADGRRRRARAALRRGRRGDLVAQPASPRGAGRQDHGVDDVLHGRVVSGLRERQAREAPHAQAVTSILDGARERGPFAGEGGQDRCVVRARRPRRRNARRHQARLADDWMLIVAGGVSYLHRLWQARVLRADPARDRPRDARDGARERRVRRRHARRLGRRPCRRACPQPRGEPSRARGRRRACTGEFWGEDVPGCPLYDHFDVFNRRSTRLWQRGSRTSTRPIPGLMRARMGACSVTSHRRTSPTRCERCSTTRRRSSRELEKRPVTLIHGDLRLHNIGLTDDRVVLLDWEIAGNAPPAVEFGVVPHHLGEPHRRDSRAGHRRLPRRSPVIVSIRTRSSSG